MAVAQEGPHGEGGTDGRPGEGLAPRGVHCVRMDGVRSVHARPMEMTARTTPGMADDRKWRTPKRTRRTSAAIVPKTPTMTTASQYVQVR